MLNTWTKWTNEEEKILLAMRQAGLKASYISHKLNKSECSIYNKIGEMKLASEYSCWGELWDIANEMKSNGKSYREIAEAIGKKTETVRQKFVRERKKEKNK